MADQHDLNQAIEEIEDIRNAANEALRELEMVDHEDQDAVRSAARNASTQLRGPNGTTYAADLCDELETDYEVEQDDDDEPDDDAAVDGDS